MVSSWKLDSLIKLVYVDKEDWVLNVQPTVSTKSVFWKKCLVYKNAQRGKYIRNKKHLIQCYKHMQDFMIGPQLGVLGAKPSEMASWWREYMDWMGLEGFGLGAVRQMR